METITVMEALFNAFAEGEVLNDDPTRADMAEEFAEGIKHLKAGNMDEDNLYCLQYAAMKAGFYAGVKAVSSLLCQK